jgi:deoxyribodipyrimidine photo-lyase
MSKINLFWHRRDLRLHDNAGLYHALNSDHPVLPVFIFDTNILNELPRQDARVEFIRRHVAEIDRELQQQGSALLVKYGDPVEIWEQLCNELDVAAVFTNRDYEPYATERDQAVEKLLEQKGIAFHTYKDHVIFEEKEVVKADGDPYTVFTPYSRKWKEKLNSKMVDFDEGAGGEEKISFYLKPYPTEACFSNLCQTKPFAIPTLAEMGFEPAGIEFPPSTVARKRIRNYDKTRNFPANEEGTSRLGVHFRFGTVSIREKARKAGRLNDTYLNELIWRDFYAMILANFPRVANHAFRPEYDHIPWRNDEEEFRRWRQGKTGYPIVDAGMRELNQTGYMHNRVRMITASFLTKHLLVDWRWGEAYFAEKLLDYDLASNNGGWQWAAGCGTDAAPYFRIFNPYSQQEKFDKDKKYIKRWVPEYGTGEYPQPIVDHKDARERCLEVYKKALEEARSRGR